MNSKIKRVCAALAVVTAVASMGTAFAADETEEYGFRKGKANHYGVGVEQTFVYSSDPQTAATDAVDYGYRKGKASIGGVHMRHLDSETLVEAGIIDQATADAISEYSAKKHEEISTMHENMADMTPEERSAAFEGRKTQRKDCIAELAEAGVITDEQAEAIKNYTPEE